MSTLEHAEMKQYIKFPEEITKLEIYEKVNKHGVKLEYLIVNNTWKLTPTENADHPFKKTKLRIPK